MEVFLAQLISGLTVGSIYGLMVTGYNLMYVVAGVIQFAYPHVVVLSMYVAWYVFKATGNNMPLAILATIGSGIGISLATEPIFRPLTRRMAWIASLVAALGMSMVITDVMSHGLNAGMIITFPESFTGVAPIFQVGLATLFRGQLMTFIGAISAMLGFVYLLYRTQLGRAFRAMAQNPFVARLRGIPIAKTSRNSYIVAGLLGGISAVFLTMALCYASPALGGILALKMLAIAVAAGKGALRGGLILGLIIGLVESMVVGFAPGNWSVAAVFGVLLIGIIVKPEGLFIKRA